MFEYDGKGKRYNKDKVRIDLIPPEPLNEVAKVFTVGANKYGDYNWMKGMNWSTVIASLERHLNAFKTGQDYDEETGLYHMAHLVANGMFLLQYYKTFPQGDNRIFNYYNTSKNIALDIDDVIVDFLSGFKEYLGIDAVPEHWKFFKDGKVYTDVSSLPKEFWLNLKPKIQSKDIKFTPKAYITHRTIPIEWTIEWLELHGFPAVPIHMVEPTKSKLDVAKELNIEVFVDDKFETFVEFNKNGILCWLFDSPQNKKYDVGYKRVTSLNHLN